MCLQFNKSTWNNKYKSNNSILKFAKRTNKSVKGKIIRLTKMTYYAKKLLKISKLKNSKKKFNFI